MLTVAETPSFTRLWQDYWTEEERGELCAWILANPEVGDVVPRTGGVRKVRWSQAGRGKRGGVRVVYYNQLAEGRVWALADLCQERAGQSASPCPQCRERDA